MKISFWIPAVVLYVVKVAFTNSVQVGTVLFTTTDLVKKCWTDSDKSLLKARLIMQDILPDPSCIDFSKPEAAVILLDYFHACYQVISTSTYGKIQNLMYIALSDVLGGYLRAYVLPFTRKAYYAGELKYSDARKLFQLYDDIRVFLKTSGMGWAEPQKMCYKKIRVKPLVITGGSIEACNNLYTIESEGKLHCINALNKCSEDLNTSKNSKASFREENSKDVRQQAHVSNSTLRNTRSRDFTRHKLPFHNATGTTHSCHTNRTKERRNEDNRKKRRQIFNRKIAPLLAKRVIIPLPVLDDCVTPHSIAVPFRRKPLRNLGTQSSAFILEQYYLAVIKCFIAKGNTRTDIRNFNSQFHSWLVSDVFPRLNDEKWYPAFGGVLRVMETIRKFGAETTVRDPILHDIAYMFGRGVDFEVTDNPKLTGREKTRDVTRVEDCDHYAKRHYVTAVLVASLIWIFIFCACAFFLQATKGHYLLYEGNSERLFGSRKLSEEKLQDNKFLNFEFIVKFFRRTEKPSIEQVYHYIVENEKGKNNKFLFDPKYTKGKGEGTQQIQEENSRKKERGRLVMTGQGDVPTLLIPKAGEEKQFNQPWTFVMPVTKEETMEETRSDRDRPGEGREEVQTLWKKSEIDMQRIATSKDGDRRMKQSHWSSKGTTTPTTTTSNAECDETSSHSCSASAEEETKGSSTDKRSSYCCCSESCRHTSSTSTNSSPLTQLDEKFSSATMDFSDRVITKHKRYRSNWSSKRFKGHKGCKKDPAKKSTLEDGSNNSSESDY